MNGREIKRSAKPRSPADRQFRENQIMAKNRESRLRPTSVTLLGSLLAGFLFCLWANRLDPNGAGDSIPIIPVIVSLFLACIALFATGVICRKQTLGLILWSRPSLSW